MRARNRSEYLRRRLLKLPRPPALLCPTSFRALEASIIAYTSTSAPVTWSSLFLLLYLGAVLQAIAPQILPPRTRDTSTSLTTRSRRRAEQAARRSCVSLRFPHIWMIRPRAHSQPPIYGLWHLANTVGSNLWHGLDIISRGLDNLGITRTTARDKRGYGWITLP